MFTDLRPECKLMALGPDHVPCATLISHHVHTNKSSVHSLWSSQCLVHLSTLSLLCVCSGPSATQRTTTTYHLLAATECCLTETPLPASHRPPLAWWASPPWGHLESHRGPLCATNLLLTGEWVSSLIDDLTSQSKQLPCTEMEKNLRLCNCSTFK